MALRISTSAKSSLVRQKAEEKWKAYYRNLYEESQTYLLLYEDGQQVLFLPGTSELFSLKGPLKYLVAKLHRCYPGGISLPVSQNFFARFFRRRPVADSSRCLTFSLRCNKHKKHFLLTFLLINGLLYGYNMCVVPLFFILECFACRKMSSTYGRRLHVTLSC